MSPDPMIAAMRVTKNRIAPLEAGIAKKLRSGVDPGNKIRPNSTVTIEEIVTSAAPIPVTTIAAGRRNSRRSPVVMMARTRWARGRSGISRRLYVGRVIDTLGISPGLALQQLEEQFLEASDDLAHVPHLGPERLRGVEDRGLDAISAAHIDRGGAHIRVEPRLLQTTGEAFSVAADVDSQADRRACQESIEVSRSDLMPAVQDDDVLADRLDVGEEVA